MERSSEGGSSFRVPFSDICRTLKEKGYGTVLLQVPEGLKREAFSIASEIERMSGCSLIIDGEICFGACDHAGTRAYLLGLDAVIHLGHADIPSMTSRCSVPLHFFPTPMNKDAEKLISGLQEVLEKVEEKRIGLATTVQHLDLIQILQRELENRGYHVQVGTPGKREEFPGQVLGCSFHSPRTISGEVDEFIYIGTGMFHPLGMVNAVKKRVWALDPLTGAVNEYGKRELDGFLRKRWAAIASARDRIESGGCMGVIIGSKPGQMRCGLAESALAACREKGYSSSLVVMDNLDPMKLRSLGIEVAAATACPRIVYDDTSKYGEENVVLLTEGELMIALGVEKWDNYTFDEKW